MLVAVAGVGIHFRHLCKPDSFLRTVLYAGKAELTIAGHLIATTSGTASEINCWGVISNRKTHEKIGFGRPELAPVLAIVDPELMRTVPAKYTTYQGFDALFDCNPCEMTHEDCVSIFEKAYKLKNAS